MSAFLFCLAKEVPSRSISKLVHDGNMSLMSGPRNSYVPSHALYVDDVMIYCRGTQNNLLSLLYLFQRYGSVSGKIINPNKSTFFAGGAISSRRRKLIAELLGFVVGKLPYFYLGIPIFKGKPKLLIYFLLQTELKQKLQLGRPHFCLLLEKLN